MAEDARAIVCNECGKQLFNEPMLANHVFLTHDLPKLFKDDDPDLFLLRKAHAYHLVRGECEKHGPTDCICIHPSMDSKEGELILKCYPCILEAHKGGGG